MVDVTEPGPAGWPKHAAVLDGSIRVPEEGPDDRDTNTHCLLAPINETRVDVAIIVEAQDELALGQPGGPHERLPKAETLAGRRNHLHLGVWDLGNDHRPVAHDDNLVDLANDGVDAPVHPWRPVQNADDRGRLSV